MMNWWWYELIFSLYSFLLLYIYFFFFVFSFSSSGITCILARCSEIRSGIWCRTRPFVGHLLIFGHQCCCLCIVDRIVRHSFIPSLQDCFANDSKNIRWSSVQVSLIRYIQIWMHLIWIFQHSFLQRLFGSWSNFARGKSYTSRHHQCCTCECILGWIKTIIFGWRLCRFS